MRFRLKMGKKMVITSSLVVLAVLLVLLLLGIWGYGMAPEESADVHVIFVPGFWTEENAPESYEEWLREVFPDDSITVRQWRSNQTSWERAKLEADLFANELAKEIYAMKEEERKNLVLIGHSIGARVVVKAMADLNGYGMSIRRGVFLGAALPDDDENIPKALLASRRPCINISNRKDYVLSVIYSSIVGDHDACALGAYGSKVRFSEMSLIDVSVPVQKEDSQQAGRAWDIFKQLVLKNIWNYQKHYAELYFMELQEVLENEALANVIYPPHRMRRLSDKFDSWKTISKSHGWELRRHSWSRQLCIVNPKGILLTVDDSKSIKERFAELERQLTDADLRNNQEVIVMQDEKVEVEKVLPIDFLWVNIEEFDGWQLQKLKIGNSYRIVDPRDYLRAAGSGAKMRESFNSIREQLTNGIVM